MVVRAQADETLLDTYDEERRPIEQKVITRTDTLFHMVGAQGGLLAFRRDNLLPLFGQAEPVQRFITDFVGELGIEYRSSSLTLPDKLNGGAQAGDRAADAAVGVPSGPSGRSGEVRIFDLIHPAKFTLLLLDSAASAEATANDQAGAIISQALPQLLNVWHVTNANAPALVEEYGIERPCFYLIRPDGYVMLRGTWADADRAADFCRRWVIDVPVRESWAPDGAKRRPPTAFYRGGQAAFS